MGILNKFMSSIGYAKKLPQVPKQQVGKSAGSLPSGRVSQPTINPEIMFGIKNKLNFINPAFVSSLIPIIRKLTWINPDFGLAVWDMVQLTNTGHRIKFDPGVSATQIDKMRQHISNIQEIWGDGVSGMDGLVNKMISQIWISGALSAEWVVDKKLNHFSNLVLVNPETIVFRWDKGKGRFFPYQKQNWETGQNIGVNYVRLNPYTYRYYSINGDTELPYAIPPLLTALNAISTQVDMDQNTRYIIKQIGLLGFFEMLLAKPDQNEGESDSQYAARLNKFLDDSKKSVLEGISEGVVVGLQGDHEFKFNSTTKDLRGVTEIYNQNEQQVANGLKISSEFLGVGKGGSETGINILFTKMLSQLQNVQSLVAAFLKYGYTMELRLAGFNFQNLRVEFNPSTITDELKFQQSQEYKIRNVSNKYNMGIIGQQQAADELGYDKPDAKEPRAPISDVGAKKEKRQDQNDESDKKTRDKSKPQPKRKEQK